jgi:hypothetical protein
MPMVTITLREEVLLEALQAALSSGLSLDQFISDRIEAVAEPEITAENFDAESVAQEIYAKAAELKKGDEFTVEELHRFAFPGQWKNRTAGQRIAIGRAFKKLADAEHPLKWTNSLWQGFVVFLRKDSQNRAIYSHNGEAVTWRDELRPQS